jgi:hypothetical protein
MNYSKSYGNKERKKKMGGGKEFTLFGTLPFGKALHLCILKKINALPLSFYSLNPSPCASTWT